jgi:16S rRNA (guanine966-N2)-methyltransferase
VRIIAGRWGGRVIAAPPGHQARPTQDRVREAWLGALQFDLPGSRVLDLFAGSGALGLEALSRGAAHVTFVEHAAPVLRTLRENVRSLGATAEVEIIRADALKYARRLGAAAFDVVLADPPYRLGLAAELVEIFTTTRFAGLLCVEHAVEEALPHVPGARTRVYGDTMITSMAAES